MSGRRPVVEDPSESYYTNNEEEYYQQDASRKSQSQRRPSMEMNVDLSRKAVRRESARRSSGRVMLYTGPDADNNNNDGGDSENGGRQDTHSKFWVNDDKKKLPKNKTKNKTRRSATNDGDDDDNSLDDDVKVIWVEDPDHRSISSAEERRQQLYHKIVKGLILCSAIIVCILVIVIAAILIHRYVIKDDDNDNADVNEFGDPLDKFAPLSGNGGDGGDDNNSDQNGEEFVCDLDKNGGRPQSGNEVLVATTLDRAIKEEEDEDGKETVQYQCTFRDLWTEQRQPMAFPAGQARWEGGAILWTHNGGGQFQPFLEDSTSSLGVQTMIQNGQTNSLVAELNQQQQQQQVLDWKESPSQSSSSPISSGNPYFMHLPPIQATPAFSHLTMMAVTKPTSSSNNDNQNDSFTGFYDFQLIGDDNENIRPQWEDHFVIQTYPWELIPSTGITQRVNNNEDNINNNDVVILPVAELECYMIRNGDKTPATTVPWIPIPANCDYFIDPCCQNQQGGRCNKLLPNGRETPEISCAVQEVLSYQE